MKRPTFLDPLLKEPAGHFALANAATGSRLAARVCGAFDSASRRGGLLGRDTFADEALVIAPCEAVHTWFMRFAIDLLFVARDGRVLRARPSVAAWRFAWRLGAFATIELPAGTLAATPVAAGDHVQLVALE